MDIREQALAGGVMATAATGALAYAARRLGWFQLSFPQVLGTAISGNSRTAVRIGMVLHAVNGTGAAAAYLLPLRRVPPEWRLSAGAALGAVHSLAAMTVLAALPRLHPRPGRAGLKPLDTRSYGPLTFPALVGGHVIYGALVGWAIRAHNT